MEGHHLILGQCVDFITGQSLTDTHDERYRQQLARCLVLEKGYPRHEVVPRCWVTVHCNAAVAEVLIDFKVLISGREAMIVKYGPGSIVTRHQPALAASCLVAPHRVPVVVVTNGQSADVLNSETGALMGQGLDAIPNRRQLAQFLAARPTVGVDPARRQLAERIV
jgi:hypothetical protein